MIILTIRTDRPEAELGIFGGKNNHPTQLKWLADRQLAETIHLKIKALLESQELRLQDLQGIIVFKGPGSFTGLRIGISVANALADGFKLPIIAETGDDWVAKGLSKIEQGDNDQLAVPEYGSPPNVTKPKK
jgi:tRNA threonylcarbamoyladenosine biosynthesis protein TsaB